MRILFDVGVLTGAVAVAMGGLYGDSYIRWLPKCQLFGTHNGTQKGTRSTLYI